MLNYRRPKPMVLVILDGFGYSECRANNAIALAETPIWDNLWGTCAHTLLDCSGGVVGLPDDQMGNSEVGHLHLGSGRLIRQDFTRIGAAVADGSFFENPVLCAAVDEANRRGAAVHVLGLLSPGGVHSHEDHIHAMVELAVQRGSKQVNVHAFLDGRDTPPKSAEPSLIKLSEKLSSLGVGRIASLAGRFFAMDRDNRWERVEPAYRMIAKGHAEFQANTAVAGLKAAYDRGETDEFVSPTVIADGSDAVVEIGSGDAVIFMNFRADRARELTQALAFDTFQGFERGPRPPIASFVTLTEYQEDFGLPIAFPPERIQGCLGEIFSKLGLRQLRLAETEKYAHVTFFFNGGVEAPFAGESRILVPSPKVKTYDLQPAMSAPEVTSELVAAIKSGSYDVIICNYANGDMVGHTGSLAASIEAVQVIDAGLGEVVEALKQVGGEMLITADHGNCEQMIDPATGDIQTAHTVNPVPLVYFGAGGRLADGGNLADVAPTLLRIMSLDIPPEMTGRSLLI